MLMPSNEVELMRYSRLRIMAPVIMAGILMTALPSNAQSGPSKTEISFLISFGAQIDAKGGGKVVPVQTESVLHTGDRLKLFLEPRSHLHLYLLHVGSKGELTPLHPVPPQPARIDPGAQKFIPEGTQWFELDSQAGQEKFHLIASAEKLDRLEELCTRHVALTEAAAVKSSSESILNEIKQLRQQHQQLTAPAEKPVRIGGSVRGEKPRAASVIPDITHLATEVTAVGFFSRTFTIDHR